MDLELLIKVFERKERVAAVEAFLVFAVAALHLAVVPGRVGPDKLMPYAELGCRCLKQGWQVLFRGRKAVGELKTIVCLDAFHVNSSSSIPFVELLQEVCGGIGGLLRIGGEEAKARKLVNSGVLV